jgi:hypothetical protein
MCSSDGAVPTRGIGSGLGRDRRRPHARRGAAQRTATDTAARQRADGSSEALGTAVPPGAAPELTAQVPAAGDQGYVTAEAAIVLPSLALFTAMLLWAVITAAAQIQCVDAARAGARAAARSETDAQVRAVALSAAPRGAQVALERTGDLVRVRITARSLGPGRIAGALSADLRAEAAALAEDTVGGVP